MRSAGKIVLLLGASLMLGGCVRTVTCVGFLRDAQGVKIDSTISTVTGDRCVLNAYGRDSMVVEH